MCERQNSRIKIALGNFFSVFEVRSKNNGCRLFIRISIISNIVRVPLNDSTNQQIKQDSKTLESSQLREFEFPQ